MKDHSNLIFETVQLINYITNLREKPPNIIAKLF